MIPGADTGVAITILCQGEKALKTDREPVEPKQMLKHPSLSHSVWEMGSRSLLPLGL